MKTMASSRSSADLPPSPLAFGAEAVREISSTLTGLLADSLALYLKTKNFHWHVSGPPFRDYHRLLDEQAEQVFVAIDVIAERVGKIGGTIMKLYRQCMPHRAPTWTQVGVQRLGLTEMRFDIRVTAIID
jgi:DNA-binding ferritin-like protein